MTKNSIALSFLLIALFAQGPTLITIFGFQITFVTALFIIAFTVLIIILIYALFSPSKKGAKTKKNH